jgi:hypothetical protein
MAAAPAAGGANQLSGLDCHSPNRRPLGTISCSLFASACSLQQPSYARVALLQTGRPTLLPSHFHTNAAGLRPAAVLDHSDVHARWVASLARSEKRWSGVLERLAKRRAESEQAERAQQEQEAAMHPPASNTLIRRECCCCAVLCRLWQVLGRLSFCATAPHALWQEAAWRARKKLFVLALHCHPCLGPPAGKGYVAKD